MNELKPLKVTPKPNNRWQKFVSKYKFFFLLLIITFGAFIYWDKTSSSSVFNYVLGKEAVLKAENNQVNILLLGIAGGSHDGPTLTDTIMVVSYDLKTRKTHLVSLPRDLWSDKYKQKINAVYTTGLTKGDGLGLAATEIGDVLGISIPYVIRVDFSGFVKAVDLVEGLDVEVANSFDDYEYPIEGHEDDSCGYQEKVMDINDQQSQEMGIPVGSRKILFDPNGKVATSSDQPQKNLDFTPQQILQFFSCRFDHVSFKQGPLHLNGETALKFVRSRHGTNKEGTDFARSKRQQQVLQAFRNQVLSLGTLTDPSKVIELIKTFGNSIDTNIPQSQYLALIRMLKQTNEVESLVIDSSGDNPLLMTPKDGNYGGAWVLVPTEGDYVRIHQLVKDTLADLPLASGSGQIQK